MELLYLRIASVIVIAVAYMLFDVFNRRNVPSVFAYGTMGYGALLTVLYFNYSIIAVSALIAVAVMGFGYFLYKAGQLGLGDAFELTALSLILPIQQPALFGHLPTLGLPFVVPLLITTGISALILVPVYYVPRSLGVKSRKFKPDTGDLLKALTIGAVYAVFIIFLAFVIKVGAYGLLLMIAIAIGSISIIIFEKRITSTMVDMVDYRGFEEGDIIAFNMMDLSEIENAKKIAPSFDRLVTRKLISELKSGRAKRKFPVYKRAVPMAVPILASVIITLAFGNIVLLITPL